MILGDANVWLALALSGHVHHRRARTWFQNMVEMDGIRFCRATQQTLLRLLTTASVLAPYGSPPLSNVQAWAIYEAFVADDRVALQLDEPVNLEQHWKSYAVRDTPSPKLWMDAYLAAFATAGRLQLVTTDAAFRQFAGLDLIVLG
ncbi:MAG: TA system VapC family ribonuclease toxin [Candidatus Dormibacteria bacterium]